ncbi:adenosylcobinamide-GDP ribazoletransferase [Clostridium gasigenes]
MSKIVNGLLMAISMFTIIPLPKHEWNDAGAKHILKFYPLIGLIVGGFWYGVYKLLVGIDASIILISALTMVTPFIITGMLHLDGYMDVCDAMLSRRDKKEKIRILKDPNTGAFSVIALAMLFIVNFASTYTVIDNGWNLIALVLIPVISRSFMGFLLLTKESMPESSLGSYFKKGTGIIDKILLLIFILIPSIVLILILGIEALGVPLAMIGITIIFVNNSCMELGGMSGDIAGFGLVIAESIGLLIVALM